MAAPEVKRWLEDPSLCLLPRDQWPAKLPRASMNIDRQEWPSIAKTLVDRGILAPVAFEDILQTDEGPVLNGMFSVIKKGTPGPGESRVTRLIMNLTPSNSLQVLQPVIGLGASCRQGVPCCGRGTTSKVRSTHGSYRLSGVA